MMHVGKTQPHKDMPPLMGAAPDIKLARQHTLGELGNVEGKGKATEQIEDDDSWQEDLDFITVESIETDPVDGWDEPIDGEGTEVDQSQEDILILVHDIPEDSSKQDEACNCGHVECAPVGEAPESIIDSYKHRICIS